MILRIRLMLCVLALILSGCDFAVTSLTPSTEQPVEENTEIPETSPTPYPDTPAPPTIDAPLIESPAFTELHFLNELDGWGITETYVVRTNDGGSHWYDVTPEELDEAGAMVETFMLDQDHAWVQKPDFNNYPNNGLLYSTDDGGLTWTASSTPFSSGDLTFVDADDGWMLADLGVGAGSNAVAVFQTMDGGATWTQTYTNDPNNPEAADSLPLGGIKADLVPLNMQTAWVGGVVYSPGTPYLYRTDDSGHTWSLAGLELPEGAEEVELGIDRDQMRFTSAMDGFLIVRMSGDAMQTAVYVTHDAGESWTLTPTLIPGAGASDILSSDETIIYNGEQFYVTHDGAMTWTTVTPDIVFGDSFVTMDFVNPNSGWVITLDAEGHHALYRTHDGGATWSAVA